MDKKQAIEPEVIDKKVFSLDELRSLSGLKEEDIPGKIIQFEINPNQAAWLFGEDQADSYEITGRIIGLHSLRIHTGLSVNIKNNLYAVEFIDAQHLSFDRIKQNGLTGELIKLSSRHKKPDETGSLSIYTDKITGTINGFDNLIRYTLGMNAETWRFFDFLMKLAYERGFTGANPTVVFSLDEYMILRGYKNTKPNREAARKRLKAELDILYSADVSYNNRFSGYSGRLVVNKEISQRSGLVSVSLHNGLKPLIEQMRWFFYPRQLWTLNLQYYPNSYYLGRRISLHKSMNYHKKNADIISVKALIESSPELPKYEDLKSGSQLRQRIIDPFERDMDIITAFNWQYISRNGDIVNRLEISKYEQFISFNIKIDWKNYPELDQKPVSAKKPKKKRKS